MNRTQLVEEIQMQMSSATISKKDIGEVVQYCFDLIREVAHTETVKLKGFGQFHMVTRKARMGRNPRTGETITIPERQELKFKASSK